MIGSVNFTDVAYGVKLYGVARGSSQVLIADSLFHRCYYYGVYAFIASIEVVGSNFTDSPVYWMSDWWTWTSAIGLVRSTSAPNWYDVRRSAVRHSRFNMTGGGAICGYFSDPLLEGNLFDQVMGVQAVMIKGGTGYDPSQGAFAHGR